MTTFLANLPGTPRVYSARYHHADGATEFVTVTRIDRGAGRAHIIREGDEHPRDDIVPTKDLSSFVALETRPIVVAEDGSVSDFFATSVYDVPSRWDRDAVDYAIAVQALEAAGRVSHPEDVNRARIALMQCQEIAYDAMVEIENAGSHTTLGDLIDKGTESLGAVNRIAGSGCPTAEFAAMLARTRREEEEAEGASERTKLTPPEGCTGEVAFSPTGRASILHGGPTCPVHEDATPADRSEELREQAARVIENYRAGEDVGEPVEALATILRAWRAVRDGWRPDRDEEWIGCEVECDDDVAFTVIETEPARDGGRVILRGGGNCRGYADRARVLHPPRISREEPTRSERAQVPCRHPRSPRPDQE
ncbi:MAG: hypothetical protein JSS68_01925 [Actinobacteria bacterium]|nr:hypothetical protein [Actinomycetota bacterium]